MTVDVVQLPHLNKFSEFLMLERRDLPRFIYAIRPESLSDKAGYEEFMQYLLRGRNGAARAGIALEMEALGFKIFIVPPSQATRALGYMENNMIAVLRKRP